MGRLEPFRIDGVELSSRLLVGTGKFPSPESMAQAIEASGTEIVTVALRRVDLDAPDDRTLAALDFDRYRLLPNTSGARDADEAVRLARLGRAASGTHWVKLEVTPEPNYLLPDPVETLRAAETLVAEADAWLMKSIGFEGPAVTLAALAMTIVVSLVAGVPLMEAVFPPVSTTEIDMLMVPSLRLETSLPVYT